MCEQVPSSKLLGSPVRAHPEAPETQLSTPGQPGLPSSQQLGQQTVLATATPSEDPSSAALSAPQPLLQAPEALAVEDQSPQVPQAPAEVLGPQAPIRAQEEPQQPVSPLPVGRMTQVAAARAMVDVPCWEVLKQITGPSISCLSIKLAPEMM